MLDMTAVTIVRYPHEERLPLRIHIEQIVASASDVGLEGKARATGIRTMYEIRVGKVWCGETTSLEI